MRAIPELVIKPVTPPPFDWSKAKAITWFGCDLTGIDWDLRVALNAPQATPRRRISDREKAAKAKRRALAKASRRRNRGS